MNSNVLENGNTEIWTDADNWISKVLTLMGEASFKEIQQAIEDNKKVTYRYIVENHYTESIYKAGSKIGYSQIFIEGVNAGYFEEHPHREYKKLEDGRTVAVGEPTIYYDLILPHNIHRIGSVYVWIGEGRGELSIRTLTHKPILEDGEPWESEIEVNHRLLSAIEEIKKANPKETYIAVNPHRKEGEPYAIAYINGEIDKAVELYCYTIGETEYLEQNVPNITFNERTSFYNDPVLLFCGAFFIEDKEFEMNLNGAYYPCKIKDKKLYYLNDIDDWKEAIPSDDFEKTSLFGYEDCSNHRKIEWALEHCGTGIKLAVMNDYDSFYCKGDNESCGDIIQLTYK